MEIKSYLYVRLIPSAEDGTGVRFHNLCALAALESGLCIVGIAGKDGECEILAKGRTDTAAAFIRAIHAAGKAYVTVLDDRELLLHAALHFGIWKMQRGCCAGRVTGTMSSREMHFLTRTRKDIPVQWRIGLDGRITAESFVDFTEADRLCSLLRLTGPAGRNGDCGLFRLMTERASGKITSDKKVLKRLSCIAFELFGATNFNSLPSEMKGRAIAEYAGSHRTDVEQLHRVSGLSRTFIINVMQK